MLRRTNESTLSLLSLASQRTFAICSLIMLAIGLLYSQVSQAALVSHWALDDGSGTTASDSAGTNPATLGGGGNAPTWIASPSSKLGPSALDFDGGDFASAPDSPSLDISSAITISTWVKRDLAGLGVRQIFLGKANGSGPGTSTSWFEFTASNGVRFMLGDGTTDHAPIAPALTDTSDWHLLTGTYDGTTQTIYIDGAFGASQTWSGSLFLSNDPFSMGQTGSLGSLRLDGQLDDVGVWDNALTPPEVNALYTLANHSDLLYDLGEAQELFDLHDAGSGSVSIGEDNWSYDGDMSGLGLTLGEVTKIGDRFFLLLDSSTGVSSPEVPEPSSLLLLGLGMLGLTVRARRRRR